jgi:hypothetical protein
VASDNCLPELPSFLALPLLRSLRLGGNRIAAIGQLPPLPHLQELQLQDNHITSILPLHGLPQLRTLNLSFNQLSDVCQVSACLAPLLALTALKLCDNPLAQQQGGAEAAAAAHARMQPGAATGSTYREAVLAAVPWLHELDDQLLDEGARQLSLQRAAGQAAAGLPRQLRGSCCSSSGREGAAAAVLAALAEQQRGCLSAREQRRLSWFCATLQLLRQQAAEGSLVAALRPRLGSCQAAALAPWVAAWQASCGACLADVSCTAAAIAAAAAEAAPGSSSLGQQQRDGPHPAAQQPHQQPAAGPCERAASLSIEEVRAMELGTASTPLPLDTWLHLERHHQQQVTAMLQRHATELSAACAATAAASTQLPGSAPQHPAAEQLLVHASYQQAWLASMAPAAAPLQAAWRARQARRLLQQLREQAAAVRRHAAASSIQAAWRGWQARHGPLLPQLRLQLHQRRQQQAALAAAEQLGAALALQAAWRGRCVRTRLGAALAAARVALQRVDSRGSSDGSIDFSEDAVQALLLRMPSELAVLEDAQPPTAPGCLAALDTCSSQLASSAEPAETGAAAAAAGAEASAGTSARSSQVVRASDASDDLAGMDAGAGPATCAAAGAGLSHQPSLSVAGSSSVCGAVKRERHEARLRQLMQDWGFQDMATAEAYLKWVVIGWQAVLHWQCLLCRAACRAALPAVPCCVPIHAGQCTVDGAQTALASTPFRTPPAFRRRQQHTNAGKLRSEQARRLADPQERLRKLQGAVAGRPQLTQGDVSGAARARPQAGSGKGARGRK